MSKNRTAYAAKIDAFKAAAAFLPFPFLPFGWVEPPIARPKKRRDSAWLHPTKGWRGKGTRPAGTNRRRIKP